MHSSLTLFIADDHHVVREAIAQTLEKLPSVEIVKQFSNGKSIFKALEVTKPDLIFLDLEMPEWNGIKTLTEIKASYPSMKCIILSMVTNGNIIDNCLEAGANGYVTKTSSFEQLEEAIEAVLNNSTYLSEEAKIAQRSKNDYQDLEGLRVQLSKRELHILEKICDGLTAKEISIESGLSPRTVETHKSNIMQKFGVNTVGRLISHALRTGIVR